MPPRPGRRHCQVLAPFLLALLLCLPSMIRAGNTREEPYVATDAFVGSDINNRDTPKASYRNSRIRRAQVVAATDLVCQLEINRILPPDGHLHQPEADREFYTCSPWQSSSGTGSGGMLQGNYKIDPPAWIMAQHRHLLLRGQHLYLAIPHGQVERDEVVIPRLDEVTLLVDPPTTGGGTVGGSDGGRHGGRQRQLNTRARGSKRTVMLRIRGWDAEPDFSLRQLESFLYTHESSARRQLERCSQGVMTLDASRFGVLDVPIASNIDGLTNMEVMNLAEAYVNEVLLRNVADVESIRSWADLLLFVVPPGTGGWAAFATVSGKQSVYNNQWGGYLGGLLHELGHNMGMDHAFEDSVEYDGTTGYMGNVPSVTLEPLRCYNAHNHYAMGWFANRQLEIDPEYPQVVTLAGFVDYDETAVDEFVVVRVADDLYAQYNRVKDYNAGSGEMPDQLVLVRDRGADMGTDLVAGLSPGQTYTEWIRGESVTIHVCNSLRGGGSLGADVLTVSIGYGGSLCYGPAPSPPVPTPPSPPPPTPPVAPTSNPPASNPAPSPNQPSSPTVPSAPSTPSVNAPSSATLQPTDSTMAPTYVARDEPTRTFSGPNGVQSPQAPSTSKGSPMGGILAASFCLLAALAVLAVVYKLCGRRRRHKVVYIPKEKIHKEKQQYLDDVEKASVHTSDSSSTVSSDDSVVTTGACSPSVRSLPAARSLIRTGRSLMQVGHSMAASVATSCAIASVDDSSVDNDVNNAIAGLKGRVQRFRESPPRQIHTPSAAVATKASPIAEPTAPMVPSTSSSSWMSWMGLSTWTSSSGDPCAAAACDSWTNVCGYGTSQVEPTDATKCSKQGVML